MQEECKPPPLQRLQRHAMHTVTSLPETLATCCGLVVICFVDTVIVSMCCRSGEFSSSHEEGQEARNQKEDMEFDVRYGMPHGQGGR